MIPTILPARALLHRVVEFGPPPAEDEYVHIFKGHFEEEICPAEWARVFIAMLGTTGRVPKNSKTLQKHKKIYPEAAGVRGIGSCAFNSTRRKFGIVLFILIVFSSRFLMFFDIFNDIFDDFLWFFHIF